MTSEYGARLLAHRARSAARKGDGGGAPRNAGAAAGRARAARVRLAAPPVRPRRRPRAADARSARRGRRGDFFPRARRRRELSVRKLGLARRGARNVERARRPGPRALPREERGGPELVGRAVGREPPRRWQAAAARVAPRAHGAGRRSRLAGAAKKSENVLPGRGRMTRGVISKNSFATNYSGAPFEDDEQQAQGQKPRPRDAMVFRDLYRDPRANLSFPARATSTTPSCPRPRCGTSRRARAPPAGRRAGRRRCGTAARGTP